MDASTETFSESGEVVPRNPSKPEGYVGPAESRPIGTRPQAGSIRFGNTVTILGTLGSDDFPEGAAQQLIQADLAKIDETELYKNGSWVLSITSQVNYGTPPSAAQIVPLIAEVLIGSGGSAITFEIDACPDAVIAIPSGSVRVSLKWDTIPQQNGGFVHYLPPESVRVSGFIQRSFAASNAHRSFLLIRDDTNVSSTDGVVPMFAKDVMVYSLQANTAVYDVNDRLVLVEAGVSTGGVLSDLRGTQLLAGQTDGFRFPVPGAATRWRFNKNVAGADGGLHARVDFGIEL